MKHIVQVMLDRDYSNALFYQDEEDQDSEAAGDENEDSEASEEEDEAGEGGATDIIIGPVTVCTLGPYDTLDEAEAAADRVQKAFTRTEQDKISFEYDELEDEIGAILSLREALDFEDFVRRRKAGQLTAEELAEFDDD